ncbi:MAG TPA: hypothetical protein VMV01_18795 [Planctomycetota bacterium]|jgi:hypothetical protein|nr:hypothetical protein [Planctomycetota bacterium]HZJ72736.1 hypothetical protein [Planctomycetota bacterium]
MTPPAPTDTAPAPPGSRWESAWLALLLAKDVLSTPLHLVAFLFTGRRQKRRLLEELRKAAR